MIVVLEWDDIKVYVVFNDLIEIYFFIVLSKGSNFYNGEDMKKLDICLDCYVKEDGKYVYKFFIIIEVKYSLMYNIF